MRSNEFGSTFAPSLPEKGSSSAVQNFINRIIPDTAIPTELTTDTPTPTEISPTFAERAANIATTYLTDQGIANGVKRGVNAAIDATITVTNNALDKALGPDTGTGALTETIFDIKAPRGLAVPTLGVTTLGVIDPTILEAIRGTQQVPAIIEHVQADATIFDSTSDERVSLPNGTLSSVTLFDTRATPETAEINQADPAFEETWTRTDALVAQGEVKRTWIWGPKPFAEKYELYNGGQRKVSYYDKSRMEITNPNGNKDSEWYVTNGLLVNELMTGQLQTGDATFEQRQPAEINVAGDPDDPTGITYATLGKIVSLNLPPKPVGSTIFNRLEPDGTIVPDQQLSTQGVTVAHVENNHGIAAPFWEFMNSSGPIMNGHGKETGKLFSNPFYATGLPKAEAYWTTTRVGGVQTPVLVQPFERRVVTFTPSNPPGFQVEMGNVGRQYFEWRYGVQFEEPIPEGRPKTIQETVARASIVNEAVTALGPDGNPVVTTFAASPNALHNIEIKDGMEEAMATLVASEVKGFKLSVVSLEELPEGFQASPINIYSPNSSSNTLNIGSSARYRDENDTVHVVLALKKYTDGGNSPTDAKLIWEKMLKTPLLNAIHSNGDNTNTPYNEPEYDVVKRNDLLELNSK